MCVCVIKLSTLLSTYLTGISSSQSVAAHLIHFVLLFFFSSSSPQLLVLAVPHRRRLLFLRRHLGLKHSRQTRCVCDQRRLGRHQSASLSEKPRPCSWTHRGLLLRLCAHTCVCVCVFERARVSERVCVCLCECN